MQGVKRRRTVLEKINYYLNNNCGSWDPSTYIVLSYRCNFFLSKSFSRMITISEIRRGTFWRIFFNSALPSKLHANIPDHVQKWKHLLSRSVEIRISTNIRSLFSSLFRNKKIHDFFTFFTLHASYDFHPPVASRAFVIFERSRLFSRAETNRLAGAFSLGNELIFVRDARQLKFRSPDTGV